MLKKVVAAVVDGARVLDICILGDKAIEEGTKAVYTKGKIQKGALSINLITWWIRLSGAMKLIIF